MPASSEAGSIETSKIYIFVEVWRELLFFTVFGRLELELEAGGWSGVREKYCYLVSGWRLVLEVCERGIL